MGGLGVQCMCSQDIPVLLSVCVCREWSVWSSSHHFTGSGPEACSWNQSAIHTAEGETWTLQQDSSDLRKSGILSLKFLIYVINLDGCNIVSLSYLAY